jgi:hypothetical protein
MLPNAIESVVKAHLKATLSAISSVLLCVMFASSVQCQQSSPQQATTAGIESLQDLAKDTLNHSPD